MAEPARETWRRIERGLTRDVVDTAGEDVVEKRGERRIQRAKSISVVRMSGSFGVRIVSWRPRIGSREQRARHQICHQARRRQHRERPRNDLHTAGGDGGTNRIRVRLRVNERIRGSELLEAMHVAVADHRLAVPVRPPFREGVEVHVRREHRIPLDGVEQACVLRQATAQRAAGWKERMRRDDETPFVLLQTRQVGKRIDRFRRAAVIEQQHMTSLDRPFNAWNEDDAAGGRESPIRCRIELFIVKGDCTGHRTRARQRGQSVHASCRQCDPRVVRTMGMKVNFHHRSARDFTLFLQVLPVRSGHPPAF